MHTNISILTNKIPYQIINNKLFQINVCSYYHITLINEGFYLALWKYYHLDIGPTHLEENIKITL
jgi:hypothetical protein